MTSFMRTGGMKQLEKYGHQGHLGGWITSFVQGKTLECALKDGTFLILQFTDGHEMRIGWQDTHGNQLKGEPFVENLDVNIKLVGASISGVGGEM